MFCCLLYSLYQRSEMVALIVFEEDFLAFGLQQLLIPDDTRSVFR